MATKDQILSLLLSCRGSYLSGEELAQAIGISRAAVWKGVKALREAGFPIDAQPNRGYRLETGLDILSASGIQGLLNPGLPLKILVPSLQVTLLDSLGKRVDWLNQVCAQLGLEGIQAIHARAEEQALVKGYRDSFDFVTARAVAQLRLLGELCLPYVKVGGQFLAMKTTESGSELEEAAHCIKLLGGRAEEPVDYTIPGTQVTHRVLPIRKLAPTLKGYPRRWARIQKQPL